MKKSELLNQIEELKRRVDKLEELERNRITLTPSMNTNVWPVKPVPMPWDPGQRPMYTVFDAQPGAIVK